MNQLLLWAQRCYQIEESHGQFSHILPLGSNNVCKLLVSGSWQLLLDHSRGGELSSATCRGLKPTSATCFLQIFISCGKDKILLRVLLSSGKKIKIHTSHSEEIPVVWWWSECSGPFISTTERVSNWQKVPTDSRAIPLPQSPINYTIASGWQEDSSFQREERRKQRLK